MDIEEEPTTSSSISKAALEGWTKEEKYQLYLGLRYKGSKKIQELQETIPDKTEAEIQAAIDYFKNRANQDPECIIQKLKVRKVKSKPLIPLASWAKLLTDSLSYDELQTETVAALRLIADLEKFPPAVCTDNIDFRKIYHQIADAMEGKNIPDDRLILEVLNSCILDTALVSKPFIRPSTFKHLITSVNLKEHDLSNFVRPTKDNELSIIRHIAAQRNYNPLNIPEEYLTAAPATKDPKN